MAPSAIIEHPAPKELSRVKNAPLTYRDDTWEKPVADDYMYAFKYNFPLPIYGAGNIAQDFSEDDERDRKEIAHRFLKKLELIGQSRDSEAFAELFLDCGE